MTQPRFDMKSIDDAEALFKQATSKDGLPITLVPDHGPPRSPTALAQLEEQAKQYIGKPVRDSEGVQIGTIVHAWVDGDRIMSEIRYKSGDTSKQTLFDLALKGYR